MSKHTKAHTPEEVVEILRKSGKEVSVEKARLILEAMRKLAKLTLEQYFNL